MAAGKTPPIVTPTALAELETDASEEFQVSFSTTGDDQPPPQMMLKSRGGEEEMESFEADLLAQETEDRLTQLMLDDELSDARLGMGVEPGAEHSLSHVESFTSSVAAGQPGFADGAYSQNVVKQTRNHSLPFESSKEVQTASQELLDQRGSKSVVLTTHEELTLDEKEKERLEDSLIIAG